MARAKVGPSGLTVKQEIFVAAYRETGNASEAYRRAYNCENMKEATIHRNAKALLHSNPVTTRLVVLEERASAKVELDRAWILERLMSNAKAAAEAKDYTASNKALELLGKVDTMSMFVERSDVTSNNRNHNTEVPASAFDEFLDREAGTRPEAPPASTVSH